MDERIEIGIGLISHHIHALDVEVEVAVVVSSARSYMAALDPWLIVDKLQWQRDGHAEN